MITDEMKRSKEKGVDKWIDLATCIWDLIDVSTDFLEDLTTDRLNMLIKMRFHKSFFKGGNKLRKLVKVGQIDLRAEVKFIEHSINECMNIFLDNLIAGLDLEEEIAEFKANNCESNGK